MKKSNNYGITLIALVITIIVLLILAGISIAMLTGSNGILNKANEADLENVRGEVQERINLALDGAYTDLLTAKYVKGSSAKLDADTIKKENGLDGSKSVLHGEYAVEVNEDAEATEKVLHIYWNPANGYGDPIDGSIVAKETDGKTLPYEVKPADSKVAASASPTATTFGASEVLVWSTDGEGHMNEFN